MLKLCTSILVLGYFVQAVAVAQDCDSRVDLSPDGRRPLGVYGLMLPSSVRGYTKRQYVGTVAQITYDDERGTEVQGFALLLNNGVRAYIDITYDYEDCIVMMPNAYRSWLPYIIRKGNRVRVDAYLIGSGGFINAQNITVLSTGGRARRGKKR
jgi:hypothetical protein